MLMVASVACGRDSIQALQTRQLDNRPLTLYDLPYSRTLSIPNWNRLWVNTGVLLAGGFTALGILEALPDESTAWSRSERRRVPFFQRWVNHVKAGPVWDGDKFIFNFILHPYGGAAYYMSARSCGFNSWGSFLYGFCISTFFWEYGVEAFNETPSVQDLVITPVVGAVLGEGFYHVKRHIVSHGYRLLGSPVLGGIVAFFMDPVNEVVGYFRGEQRRIYKRYNQAHCLAEAPPSEEEKKDVGLSYLESNWWIGEGIGMTIRVKF